MKPNRLLNIMQRELDQRFRGLEKEKDEALASLNHRLDGMNEFRSTLKDQAAQFVTKVDYDMRHDDLRRQIGELKAQLDTSSGSRKFGIWVGGVILAVANVVLTVLIVVANFRK